MQNLETDAEAYAQDISPQCNRIEAYHKGTLMKLLINGENARVRENKRNHSESEHLLHNGDFFKAIIPHK